MSTYLHELKVPREERVRWVGKHEEIGHPDHWTHTHDSRTVVHHSTSALNRLRTPQKSTYKTTKTEAIEYYLAIQWLISIDDKKSLFQVQLSCPYLGLKSSPQKRTLPPGNCRIRSVLLPIHALLKINHQHISTQSYFVLEPLPIMLPLNLKAFSTVLAVVLLSAAVLAQAPERNLTIPTTTTSSVTQTQTSLPATGGNTPANSTITPTTNGTTTTNNSTQANNNSTSHSNNTAPVKLTPIPDSTGAAGSVPVPAATGGKPNGPYGPDDQYIASSVSKVIAPMLSTCFIMSCTLVVTSYAAIA
ncbi:hypothetical protein PtB15_3B601 [Puccinia triticina]|nr:hypothetical protein PtB15_3B601 [Puccinia triticina]